MANPTKIITTRAQKALLLISGLLLLLFALNLLVPHGEKEKSSDNSIAALEEAATPVSGSESENILEVGKMAPDVAFKSAEGPKSLQSFQGQPLLVEFMSVRCPYCKKFAPELKGVAGKYPEVRFVLAGIPGESLSGLQAWSKAELPGASVLLDENGEALSKFSVVGTPTLVWIDREGRVSFYQTGIPSSATLQEQLQKISG